MAEFIAEGDIVTMPDGRRAVLFVPIRHTLEDIEPVVRCCQCRFWDRSQGLCGRTGDEMHALDYCSRGLVDKRPSEHELLQILRIDEVSRRLR